jgi:hypothetical protein
VSLVLHVVWVLRIDAIDDDFLIELNSKSVLINCYLFDVVSASDFYSGLGNKVLNNNISHKLSVSVSLLVKTVNLKDLNFVHLNETIIATRKDRPIDVVYCGRPDPVFHLTN